MYWASIIGLWTKCVTKLQKKLANHIGGNGDMVGHTLKRRTIPGFFCYCDWLHKSRINPWKTVMYTKVRFRHFMKALQQTPHTHWQLQAWLVDLTNTCIKIRTRTFRCIRIHQCHILRMTANVIHSRKSQAPTYVFNSPTMCFMS